MRLNKAFRRKLRQKTMDTRPPPGATAIKQNILRRPSSFPLWAQECLCGGGCVSVFSPPRDVTPSLPTPRPLLRTLSEKPREAFVAVLPGEMGTGGGRWREVWQMG